MWKWVLYVVLGLAGLVALVAIVGSLLPKGHRASRTETYAAQPDVVFAAISDVARYADWRTDVKRVELLPAEAGKTMFREHGGEQPLTFRIEVSEPPRRMVTRIADTGLPFGGSWTYDVQPAAGGTALTITEDGEVYNPIFRFMSTFVFSPVASIEKYQTALHRAVDAPRTSAR